MIFIKKCLIFIIFNITWGFFILYNFFASYTKYEQFKQSVFYELSSFYVHSRLRRIHSVDFSRHWTSWSEQSRVTKTHYPIHKKSKRSFQTLISFEFTQSKEIDISWFTCASLVLSWYNHHLTTIDNRSLFLIVSSS